MATFFSYPLNYGSGRSQYPEVADNDYNTWTDQTTMLLNIDTAGDGTGNPAEFTDIFVKGSGIVSYTIAWTDPENLTANSLTNPQTRTLPTGVTNDSGFTAFITDRDGYQNDLYHFWNVAQLKPKATALTLTFTGTNVQVHEVMILNRLLTLNSDGGFRRIEYDSIDLGSVDDDLRGRLDYVPPIGGERDKWLVRLTALSRSGLARDMVADRLINFIRKHKNFVFAPEYNRYPDRVFPALWPNPESQIRYLARWKGAGRTVSFSVRER